MHPVHPTPLRPPRAHRVEVALLIAGIALLLFALVGPVLHDSLHQHHFADARTIGGIPCAFDVLSNLPFAVAGFWGLGRLRQPQGRAAHDALDRGLAALFCAGLVATAAGSAYYHLRPDAAGLFWDRFGMVLPFAGLLGLAAAGRVGDRAGRWTAATVLVGGLLAVLWWRQTGDVRGWAAVQLGGMEVVAGLALLPRRAGRLGIHLGAVIACYAVAKGFELADHAVWQASLGTVSGHTLKHLAAAAAAVPVVLALGRHTADGPPTAAGQNGAGRGPGVASAPVVRPVRSAAGTTRPAPRRTRA